MRKKGQTTGEFAVALLVLLPLVLGAFYLARIISLKHSLDVGCYNAARYLSINPLDEATAIELVKQEIERNVLPFDPDGVEVEVNIPSAAFGSKLTVSCRYPVSLRIPAWGSLGGRVLEASHSFLVEAWP